MSLRRCSDVNLKQCPTSTSLSVVMNDACTFKIKHSKWKGMQEKESNDEVRCGQ